MRRVRSTRHGGVWCFVPLTQSTSILRDIAREVWRQIGWVVSPKFYEYMGDVPKDGQRWSLGRIENSSGYFKGNVRWETPGQQNRNRAMTAANSSGVTGVAVRPHRDKGMRAVARWYDEAGKSRSKSFCESVYGDAYFALACEHRERMLIHLSDVGLQYANNHGVNYD